MAKFSELSGFQPRVLISDQAPSISAAATRQWSDTKQFKCSWHLKNNFHGSFPRDWSSEKKDEFFRDWQSTVQANSFMTITVRYESLMRQYPDEALCRRITHLQSIADTFSVFTRTRHQALLFASSPVEAMHAFIKRQLPQDARLCVMIEATLKLVQEQADNEAVAKARELREHHQRDPGTMTYYAIISDTMLKCTSYAVHELHEAIKDTVSLLSMQLSREQYYRAKLSCDNNAYILPSMGFVHQTIPDYLHELVEVDGNARIFRVDQNVAQQREPEKLMQDSHIVAYSRNFLAYRCTCIASRMRALICAHFLKVFHSHEGVFYHHLLWSPRWFKTLDTLSSPITPVDSTGYQMLPVPEDAIEFHENFAYAHTGPLVSASFEEVNEGMQVDIEVPTIIRTCNLMNQYLPTISEEQRSALLERIDSILYDHGCPRRADDLALHRSVLPRRREARGKHKAAKPYKTYLQYLRLKRRAPK